ARGRQADHRHGGDAGGALRPGAAIPLLPAALQLDRRLAASRPPLDAERAPARAGLSDRPALRPGTGDRPRLLRPPPGAHRRGAPPSLNDGTGASRLPSPAGSSCTYTVKLTSQGAYSDVHGDLTTATRTVRVAVVPATQAQELRAWLVTALYLFLLLLLILAL